MSLISDLCRLCLINCSSLGIPVYSNDIRRDKIRDCLSIIIEDDPRFPLIICNECDVKLNCFNQFRIDSIRAQHEFANIVKSLHGIVHYDQNNQSGYYTPELEPIKSIENMYNNPDGLYTTSSAPPTIVQNSQDYDIQFRYDLHLALDDENTESHVESHSLGNIPPNENMFEIVQQPHISPLSPATPSMVQQTSSQGIKIESSCPEQIIELSSKSPAVNTDNCYIQNLGVEQQSNVGFDIDTNHDDDSFTYDDFDDTCQSMPSDRNNVDNVIDRKIEEFIQNKTVNRVNPKICTVCNKLFRTNYKLRMHMETHSENNAKYVCEVQSCCRSFKSKIGLQEHSAVHTGIYNFTCEVCSKKFVIRSYFKAHQRVHFKEKQKSFPCSHCPKILNSKQNLIDHENHHLGLKLYKCEICLKSISTKTHLDVHMKSHNSSESFLCTTCNKHFKTKNYLKIHLKTHDESLKNYCCGFCGKKFIQMSDLKIHIKTHTGERSFICETCGRAFARKDSLSLHTKTHTQEKQFSCHCGLKFIRKHSLTNHIKKCDQLYRISNETMDLEKRVMDRIKLGIKIDDTSRSMADDKDIKNNKAVEKAFKNSLWDFGTKKRHQADFFQLKSHYQQMIRDYVYFQSDLGSYECDDFIVNEIINGNISFAYEGMECFPNSLVELLRHDIKYLDLTANRLIDFKFLRHFKVLKSLVVDQNTKIDIETLPRIETLEIFCANLCKIKHLGIFIFRVSAIFPSLKCFSMMSSPKAAISELSESRNHQLRMFAIFMMPNLIHYNDKKITDEERYHANNYHKCLGPIECKLLNYKAYPPVEDLKKLIPESIQESDDEISKLDDHDYIMNVEKGLSSFNLSLYFKNPDKKNATNDLELLLKRRAK